MRRVEEDDENDATNPKKFSSIMKDRFRYQKKERTSKSTWIIIIVAIFIYTLAVYYLINEISSTISKQKIASLQAQLTTVKNEEQVSIQKIDQLQKDMKNLKDQSQQLKKAIVSSSNDTNSKENPQNPSPPPTQESKAGSRSYMTPELKAISSRRTQKGGMVKTPNGTVCELKLLMKNKDGKTIDQVIYKDDQTRKQRIEFQKQRIYFLQKKKEFQSLGLVKYNMKYDDSYNDEEKRVDQQEYNRIKGIHQLQKFTEEIPMCLVVPGYNNNAKFRLQYNLNSIFLQNYTNYFVVIINDASTDGSDELFRKYLDFYQLNKEKYVYIENQARKTALENIYTATNFYCSNDSVVLNLDGDDEFIGKNVLKIFNAEYQRTKAGVLYSNFYWYEQGANLMLGFTSQYTDAERKGNSYRQAPQRFSHLRSYRTELFRKIETKDFQDDQGKFFTIAYDMVMYFPLMELSCGRISKIGGYHYLYNINTGLNDYQVDRNKQAQVDNKVRNSKKYTCDEDFNKKMKN